MMKSIGALMALSLTVAAGCSEPEVVSPAPTRIDALLSLARVQDPASSGKMEEALKSGVAREREVAAFGLGQLVAAWEPPPDDVRPHVEEALLAALGTEDDASVRDRIIEALGKVGGSAAAVAALSPLVAAGAPAAERVRAAIALALIARSSQRKLVSVEARDAMAQMLKDGDPSVRFGGAYGLFRYRDPKAKAALAAGLMDADPSVRATCVKAFVSLGAPEDVPALSPLLEDPDARVAAEAARTLVQLAMKCDAGSCAALDALLAAPGPWRPSVMQEVSSEVWLDPRAAPLYKARFDEYAKAMSMDEGTRALLQCQAALGHDRAAGAIDLLAQCGAGVIDDKARDVLKARALLPTGGSALDALLHSDAIIVRVTAAAGAPKSALSALLADPDPIVVGTAASRAEELIAAEVGPDLVQALGRIQGPDALEGQLSLLSAVGALDVQEAALPASKLLEAEPYALRQAAAHALAQLKKQPVAVRLPAALGPASAQEPTTVRLSTTRGTIRIRLLVDDAPRTSKSFVDLVKSAFYNGIKVHRVVPNFVSQAGDPRGDGSGGPGFTIPCEINLHRHSAGTVGMALAGRDTGGSQFFIDHSPQPHLDGLYTTFGEVIEGLDVASGLLEGDVIQKASVE